MKKQLRFLALLVTLIFVGISCRSDSDEDKNANPIPVLNGFIQVDGGPSYPINTAIVLGIDAPNSGSPQKFYTVQFTHLDENFNTKMVNLALFFPKNESINGTYTINSNTKILDDWLTSYAEGIAGSTMQSYNDLSSGTCNVTRTGNIFKVNFKYMVAGGKLITGQFDDIAKVEE